MLLPHEEVLYGGAAGGGKSDALLMGGLQYVDQPGYAALLLRRSFRDLMQPDALIPRSHEWLRGTDARWVDQRKTWFFPAGATLSFGYLDTLADVYQYQGAAYQYIGFDELTQFTKEQYLYLFSRLRRRTGSTVPLRMRSASNPGGIGHEWVKQRFMTEKADGRLFVPAKLKDNPYLDYDEYVRSLMHLDPVTREQLLNGSWLARREGGYFQREWFGLVDEAPADLVTMRFWDLAATDAKDGKDPDWTAGARGGIDEDGITWVHDIRRRRGTPQATEKFLKATAEEDGRDVPIYIEQEPGSSGKAYVDNLRRHLLQGYSVNILNPGERGSKVTLASPFSSQAQAGNVRLVRGPWLSDFFDEAEGFGVIDHDDQIDAVSSLYYVMTGGAWMAKMPRRRASAALLSGMERRMRPCSQCEKVIYFPGGTETMNCGYCGTENTRKADTPDDPTPDV